MNAASTRQQGMMLLEALIGILIFSVGILALIGMQATGANAPEIAISGSEVTVTVRWQPPGDATVSNHVAVTQINGS